MENNFNFKSAICTSREQSKKLLALGLKKETADMVLLKEMFYDVKNHCTKDGEGYLIRPIEYLEGEEHRGHIPAWSLHRIMSLINSEKWNTEITLKDGRYIIYYGYNIKMTEDPYDVLIDAIEYQITVGVFNKEYLD